MISDHTKKELTTRNDKLLEFAKELDRSDEYSVIYKYKKPKYYNLENSSSISTKKFIGAFLDIEATGLSKKGFCRIC